MDPKQIAIKIITLLFRNAQLNHPDPSTIEHVKSVLDKIEPPKNHLTVDVDREVFNNLMNTIHWMLEQPLSEPFDKQQLLQRIRLDCLEQSHVYEILADGLYDIEDDAHISKVCSLYYNELRNLITRRRVFETFKNTYMDISNGRLGDKEFFDAMANLKLSLDTIEMDTENPEEMSCMIDGFIADSEDDIEKVERMFVKAMERNSPEGGFVTGWQGFNKMLGSVGVLRRGTLGLIGAMQHRNKSGVLLKLFTHLALYNKPHFFFPERAKKALLIHLSTENEVEENTLQIYKNMREQETGEYVDIRKIDPREASRYVLNVFNNAGFSVCMRRVDGMSYKQLANLIDHFERMGYEVMALFIDYLKMFSSEGLDRNGPTGAWLQELFNKVRNLCSVKRILGMTVHQLSSDAKMRARDGNDEEFVDQVAGLSYWDGCKGIDREIDLEVIVDIVKEPGKRQSWQVFALGKDRQPDNGSTKPEDKHFAMPFQTIGMLPDDYGKKAVYCRKVGGQPVSEGGKGPWNKFDENAAPSNELQFDLEF